MPDGARPLCVFCVASKVQVQCGSDPHGRRQSRPGCVPHHLQDLQHADPLKQRLASADVRYVIELHRIHGNGTFLVNPDLIETVEACPDTVVTLVNKHRYIVEDPVAAIVQQIVEFRARIAAAAVASGDHAAGARSLAVTREQERAA